jgi:hypothetical protein
MDAHGADGYGNPLGGLVWSRNVMGQEGQWVQIKEWSNFMSVNEFSFRACYGPNAANFCPHTLDEVSTADYPGIMFYTNRLTTTRATSVIARATLVNGLPGSMAKRFTRATQTSLSTDTRHHRRETARCTLASRWARWQRSFHTVGPLTTLTAKRSRSCLPASLDTLFPTVPYPQTASP